MKSVPVDGHRARLLVRSLIGRELLNSELRMASDSSHIVSIHTAAQD